MPPSDLLPTDLARRVEAELQPGEHVLWTGQPRPRYHVCGTVACGVLILLILIATAVCFELSPFVFGDLVVLYLAFVFWTLPPALCDLWDRWHVSRTCYVVTDHRAFALTCHWLRGHELFVKGPEEIGNVHCQVSLRGVSTLRWSGGPIHHCFRSIAHAREVVTLMEEVFLPRLVFCLKDRDPEVRRKAIWSLGQLGFGAKKAMPLLVDALNSEDAVIRNRAARILGRFGQFAQAATPALRRTVLLDEDLQVSQTARRALEEILGLKADCRPNDDTLGIG